MIECSFLSFSLSLLPPSVFSLFLFYYYFFFTRTQCWICAQINGDSNLVFHLCITLHSACFFGGCWQRLSVCIVCFAQLIKKRCCLMHCDGVFPPEIAELLQSGGLDTRWCIVLGFGTRRGEEEEEKRSRERVGGRARLGVKDGKKNKSLSAAPTSSHTSQNDSD